MTIRYELIIYWSDADRCFVVDVPELPGCMADGESYEEAVANAQTVIAAGWLGRCSGLQADEPTMRGAGG